MGKGLITRVNLNIFLIIVVLLVFGIPFHYWTVDRKGVLRTVYPLEALFSTWTTKCSNGAPDWQSEMMDFGLWRLRAQASQSAFIDRNGALHHCESGWEGDILSSRLVTDESLFQYGSLTKPVTSALILSLISQNKLEFQTPVTTIFPPAKPDKITDLFSKVTMANLMNFRAGLSGEVFIDKHISWCPYRMEEMYKQTPWVLTNGSHRYSNLSYCILGGVVSEVSGRPFRAVARDALNLPSYGVRFVDAPSREGWVVPDYRYHDFYRDDLEPSFDYEVISATGGMGGSAKGYARLIRKLLDSTWSDDVLSYTDSCDITKLKNCYGYMFFTYKSSNNSVIRVKEGHMPGFSSVIAINSDKEIFVWLGNSDTPNSSSGALMQKFLDLLASRW